MTYLLTVTYKGTIYTKEFGLLSVAASTLKRIEAAGFNVEMVLLLNGYNNPRTWTRHSL